MSDENPSIMSHVSIGTNDLERAAAFYDRVLGALGGKRIHEFPEGIAYGKLYPEFWVGKAFDSQRCSVGNGTHFGFWADSKAQVDEFYRVALEAGATDDGPPGPRPLYGEPYYGAFVRDPDGHKIEAAYWDESLA